MVTQPSRVLLTDLRRGQVLLLRIPCAINAVKASDYGDETVLGRKRKIERLQIGPVRVGDFDAHAVDKENDRFKQHEAHG